MLHVLLQMYKAGHFAEVGEDSNFDYSLLLSNYYETYVSYENMISFQTIYFVFQEDIFTGLHKREQHLTGKIS